MSTPLKWVLSIGLTLTILLVFFAVSFFLLYVSYAPSGADELNCYAGLSDACSRLQTAYTVHNVELVLSIGSLLGCVGALLITGISSLALLVR